MHYTAYNEERTMAYIIAIHNSVLIQHNSNTVIRFAKHDLYYYLYYYMQMILVSRLQIFLVRILDDTFVKKIIGFLTRIYT